MAAPGVGGVLPASFKELIGLDARGLTLLRVCLGLTVLVDALARLPNACFHFADSGLISRTLLFDNMHFAMWNVNVFAATGACYPVLFLFVVYAASAFSLAIGYFTRFCTFLCWVRGRKGADAPHRLALTLLSPVQVFVMSMQHRNPAVHDSGDFYLRMVLFWCPCSPLGAPPARRSPAMTRHPSPASQPCSSLWARGAAWTRFFAGRQSHICRWRTVSRLRAPPRRT